MPCNQRTTAAVLAAALFFLPEGHTAPPAPRDGEWPMATLDYANTRYSPLTQVDARNVSSLKVEFT
ncbi:MAG TPA: hypothetical protein VGE88_19015, partial [Lysobacter sp.]